MRVSAGVAATKKNLRSRLVSGLCAFWVLCISACSGSFETEPLVEFSTELRVDGARPQSFSRQLREGEYLIEIRERDIDLRVGIDTGEQHTDLADAYLRHGRPYPLQGNYYAGIYLHYRPAVDTPANAPA